MSKEIFSYIHDRVWKYLWRWAKRRHPNKSKKWVTDKYFGYHRGNNWGFLCQTKGRRNQDKTIALFDIAKVPIERHIKVKGEASPFDPTLKEYWENRKTKLGKSYWEKNSKMWNIAQLQSWKCPVCGEHLFNGEHIETHHIVAVAAGGLDDIENLQHLHETCHKQVHYKPKNMARSKA